MFHARPCLARDSRGIELTGIEVDVTGRYDGPIFSVFRIVVRAESPRGVELARLVEAAERVCYVTRALRSSPARDRHRITLAQYVTVFFLPDDRVIGLLPA